MLFWHGTTEAEQQRLRVLALEAIRDADAGVVASAAPLIRGLVNFKESQNQIAQHLESQAAREPVQMILFDLIGDRPDLLLKFLVLPGPPKSDREGRSKWFANANLAMEACQLSPDRAPFELVDRIVKLMEAEPRLAEYAVPCLVRLGSTQSVKELKRILSEPQSGDVTIPANAAMVLLDKGSAYMLRDMIQRLEQAIASLKKSNQRSGEVWTLNHWLCFVAVQQQDAALLDQIWRLNGGLDGQRRAMLLDTVVRWTYKAPHLLLGVLKYSSEEDIMTVLRASESSVVDELERIAQSVLSESRSRPPENAEQSERAIAQRVLRVVRQIRMREREKANLGGTNRGVPGTPITEPLPVSPFRRRPAGYGGQAGLWRTGRTTGGQASACVQSTHPT